jgi:hypothetical protein
LTGPWLFLKKRWYRRQAKRAIWFLRYMDRVLHESGISRADIRTAWKDFHGSVYFRQQMLDHFAVLNKIKIRRANKTRLQKLHESLLERYSKLMSENVGLRKRVTKLEEYEKKCMTKTDEVLADLESEQLKEVPNEVPGV